MANKEQVPQEKASAITVVIPTFNRREWLQRAVESVLQEARIPVQVHVFDNASTDETETYVRSAMQSDGRIRYFRSATNTGLLSNFARAFDSIETEYFVPLADDDWLLPDFLFDAYHEIQREKALGAVIFITGIRSERGDSLETYPGDLDQRNFGFLNPKDHVRDWMTHGHYAWSSILWRTKVLESIGSPYLHAGLPSDVDFQLQVFCRYPVHLINRRGAVFYVHGISAARALNLSHIGSWAAIFRRLDRSARDLHLFSLTEYKDLRKVMYSRYRGHWHVFPKYPLNRYKLLSFACCAGFRLGDWDLARDLVSKAMKARTESA